MRRIAGGGVTVAITIFAVLPAAAAARPTVDPSTVRGAASVPAGGSKSLTLTCPGTAVALHAAPVRMPSGVRVVDSGPGDDAGRWTMRLASVADRARRVSATLRCVTLDLPNGLSDVTVRVSTEGRPRQRVPAGTSVAVGLRCPSGYIPTGQGVGMSTRAVKLVAAVPNGRGWRFRFENNGEAAATANARIRCLQRVVFARRNGSSARLIFGVKRVTYTAPVPSGKSVSIVGSCGSGRFSLGTGLSLDRDDDIALLRSYPFASRGGSSFFRNRGAPEPVESYLLCLSRSSRFR
jgi:hypothetical protein